MRHCISIAWRALVSIPTVSILAASVLSGCANFSLYSQAIHGHQAIASRVRPIEEVVQDPRTPSETRRKLELVQGARDFAVTHLSLPDGPSYREYADLGRPHALWNVIATPEFSLVPRTFCVAIIGCASYQGYFAEEEADRLATRLRSEGDDVLVAGVDAYSTLGWLSDPVLSTMLARPDPELAGLIFHELAHQVVYVADDTTFNESFAMVVEIEGVNAWMQAHAANALFGEHEARRVRRAGIQVLLQRGHERLAELYDRLGPPEARRTAKQASLDEVRTEFAGLRATWGGYAGYDAWFGPDLNNARFAVVSLYHGHVPALRALFAQCRGEWPEFIEAIRALGRLPKAERESVLKDPNPTPCAPAP